MKYKVGDKVRVKEDLKSGNKYGGLLFVLGMECLKGKIVTIKSVHANSYGLAEIAFHWTDEMLENVENEIITKKDLRANDIITLRNGDMLSIDSKAFFNNLTENYSNDVSRIGDFDDDLTFVYNKKENDIVKVERPIAYKTIYAREKTKRKMTVAQICKELGCDVEIIKEEE